MRRNKRRKVPPPVARSRADIEHEILSLFPDDFGRWLTTQIRPAVFIQPRPAPADLGKSRFGGKPLAPRGWVWPELDEEPMLFVAQINCAELQGKTAAAPLPRQGLLSFFGDPDIAIGCGPGGGDRDGAVFHWPVGTALELRDPPEPDIEILPCVGLEFLETSTLPDPASRSLHDRVQDFDFRMRYPFGHGIALPAGGDESGLGHISQLLGWHHLVQDELETCRDPNGAWRLLLQVGDYDNGARSHYWGPGGILYFVIRDEDLAAGRFDRVVFHAQHS